LALETVLVTQSQSGGGGGGDSDAMITKLANSILAEVPQAFDQPAAEKKYPISYTQSMNTVLTQELTRFNGLIKII
jgi:dynein heavy chain